MALCRGGGVLRLRRRGPIVAALLAALPLAASGCGAGGVGKGATATVYVSVPLHGDRAFEGKATCAAARRRAGPDGDVRIRVVCLDDTGGRRRWSLAAVGADARRATEDSTAVGYIGEPDPAAARFSQPILEAAGIAQLSDLPANAAMTRLRHAIRAAGSSGDLRESVRDELR